MLLGADFDQFFIKTIKTLSPYLDEIVCGGGVASALYRFHKYARNVPFGYLGTKDFDAFVPPNLPAKDRPPLLELLKQAGFQERFFGSGESPVVKYVPTDSPFGTDLEFLCAATGVLGSRNRKVVAHPIQKGVLAQPLRYLEVPLKSYPCEMELRRVPEFHEIKDITVNIPNPTAYVFQKILIRDQGRAQASKDKDCFYIYEISVVFRDAMDWLREEYDRLAPCHVNWKKRFAREIRLLFASEDSEGPLAAADLVADSGGTIESGDRMITTEVVCRSVDKLITSLLD